MAGMGEENQPVLGIDEEGQDKGTDSEGNDRKGIRLEGEKDMAPATGNSMHKSGSRSQLDVSKAEIQADWEDKYPAILLPNQSEDLSHLALDLGGSLIKLVYFSRHEDQSTDDKRK